VAAAVEAGSEAGSPVPIGVETADPGRFDPEKLVALLAALGQPAIDRDEQRPLRTSLLAAVSFLLLGFVASHAAEPTPQELFTEAVQLFLDAKPVESARKFDQLALAVPGAEPELWQRGLALYYAERFQDGRRQFELHRTVNPNDVENPAWHFLCVAKLEGIEAAHGKLLPVGEDLRVPMKEILAFYAGKGEAAAVLAAAEKGEGEARKNQLCYAHLYLGLFYEVAGDAVKAREHLTQAAGPFRMEHYMGKVAVMHAKLRGWPVEESPASPPQ
jgi:lipoprotein NlpI